MSLSCIPEEEESTRSTKVDLKDSRDNSNLKDCRDNSNLKDCRDNSNLKRKKKLQDNSNLKDCMGSSKEEPESILEAYIRKRNERLECKLKNPRVRVAPQYGFHNVL
ncbi:hypothetical protein TNCT_401561 [Trichonephila clavata]|uniref:Uncharacterized protein n=1 Tax=Trichonephila clavata TaxID=2740835 RepID=A0A8X6HNI1_TRICU|nr:hypothetical protein TNCT_401561 [Trichonephila clavata]